MSRATGVQSGMPENPNNVNTYSPKKNFVEIDRWSCFGHDDFVSDDNPIIESKCGRIIVQARENFIERNLPATDSIKSSVRDLPKYSWESGLPNL